MSAHVCLSRSGTQRKSCWLCSVELRDWGHADVLDRALKGVVVQAEEKALREVRREVRPDLALEAGGLMMSEVTNTKEEQKSSSPLSFLSHSSRA